jgi:hypothetical protein
MPHSLEALEKAFDFGFILRPQQLISRCGKLTSLQIRGCHLAPKLAVGNPVNESVLGTPAQMAEKTLSGIDISRIDENHSTFSGKSEINDKRRHPRRSVQTTNFAPRDDSTPEHQMMLVHFNRRLKSKNQEDDCRDTEQNRCDPSGGMLESDPRRKCRQAQGDQARGKAETRGRITSHDKYPTSPRLAPSAFRVKHSAQSKMRVSYPQEDTALAAAAARPA